MFVNHAAEQEEQDVSFEQSGWASTQSSNRWTTKVEVSLIKKIMRVAFSKARSQLDLRHRHASKGTYLETVEKNVRLRDDYSPEDTYLDRSLGGHSNQLTICFVTMRAASKKRVKAMMKTMIKLTMSLGLTVIVAQQAHAQSGRKCAPRDAVIERLAGTYGETRQSIGLGEQGMMIETFASENTGTWTITVTNPNGQTCLVASGRSFEQLAEALPPKGNDA